MSLAQKINRVVAPFEVISPYQPSGDQPKAIAELAERGFPRQHQRPHISVTFAPDMHRSAIAAATHG